MSKMEKISNLSYDEVVEEQRASNLVHNPSFEEYVYNPIKYSWEAVRA